MVIFSQKRFQPRSSEVYVSAMIGMQPAVGGLAFGSCGTRSCQGRPRRLNR